MGKLGNVFLRALWPCLAALAATAVTQASAQVTSAQQSAIKASCRSDFMAKCSGVTPGGKGALACLQKNVAGLSAEDAARITHRNAAQLFRHPLPDDGWLARA